MSSQEKDDFALAALLKTAERHRESGLTDLLRKAYEIERRHQFDTEEQRDSSVQELQRLLESAIESLGKEQ
jgi:hypothetical protein